VGCASDSRRVAEIGCRPDVSETALNEDAGSVSREVPPCFLEWVASESRAHAQVHQRPTSSCRAITAAEIRAYCVFSNDSIVTKSAPPPKCRVCLYCGLPSGVTSHGNVCDCVDALQHEVARLTDHLRQGKPSVPVASQPATDPRPTSARLTPVG